MLPLRDPHFVDASASMPGDVILCYAEVCADESRVRTGSAYSHAAIVIGPNEIAEARDPNIALTDFDDLLEEFDHLVLLRQHETWDCERLRRLSDLVRGDIAAGCAFNSIGMRRVEFRRIQHRDEVMARLAAVDRRELVAPTGKSHSYFCSEFVSSLFIRTGIICGDLAATAFDPKSIAPGDLNDGVYGFFVGYMSSRQNPEIRDDDEFRHDTPFHEIGWTG